MKYCGGLDFKPDLQDYLANSGPQSEKNYLS